MELTFLTKQGELSIPRAVREAFPQGGLVRFHIDQEGRLVIQPITHLYCIEPEEGLSTEKAG
ncbi:hypothetical protein HM1_1190 [Heliomicrobium modesticaldum Ice1]|uniref:SpoVT-AbrB domain-containing protein n=1 Tax=Heliobacterium modesticaldum (strain ATCC 51547 / Ice1) TaxID=498761 RepID=B0THE6_HELMI|nr:hypothetical protein [Heliomicrobium modesticaldum]ABZ83384.1 hypothetical protein HM1_1190 [Heliomicrobium modesticaldum Ice1]